MKKCWRWAWLVSGAMGLATALLSGCQTWVPQAGLTLPSGQYLRHPPAYIPPSPDFPLAKELASQEEAGARLNQAPLQP